MVDVDKASKSETSGLSWFRMGNWKSKGLRKNFTKGICPLCNEPENAIHILLECKETRETRKFYIEEKLLQLDTKIAFVKIINMKNILKLRNIGKLLFKVKLRWIKKIEEFHENRG